jgi:hypothetical protein
MRRAARLSRAETSSNAIDATLASSLPNWMPSHARFRSTRVREFATLQNSVNRNHHATVRNDRLSRTIRLEPQRRSAPLFCKARRRLQTIVRTRRCPPPFLLRRHSLSGGSKMTCCPRREVRFICARFLEFRTFCHSRMGHGECFRTSRRTSRIPAVGGPRRPKAGAWVAPRPQRGARGRGPSCVEHRSGQPDLK